MSTDLGPTREMKAAFEPILAALKKHRERIASIDGVVAIRAGFDFEAAKPVPAVVVAFRPPVVYQGNLSAELGVPVALVEASPAEQLTADPRAPRALERTLLQPDIVDFAPRRGTYHAEGLPDLEPIDDTMTLKIAASPDAGWPLLRDFLAEPARDRMAVGIYQFTAPHVYQAVRDNLRASETAFLNIGLHPNQEAIPENGSKANDIHGDVVMQRLERHLGRRFDFVRASVGSGGAFARAYHIKVAEEDGERFCLSTGNWQSSNLPPFDPINEPEALPPKFGSTYNREYHVVVEHEKLAGVFEQYLDFDRTLPTSFEAPVAAETPDLAIVDEQEPISFAPARYRAPLELTDRVKVRPLLTPDNFVGHVTELIAGAKESVYIENQYINLIGDEAEGKLFDNFPEFLGLIATLRTKVDAGLDVRILLRNYMAPEKVELLLAVGFPLQVFRFAPRLHAKLVLVDGKRALIGSHNWSNEGTVSNRDASLLFDDERIAQYLLPFFQDDWKRARPRPETRQPRVVNPGELPFAGARRANWEELYDGAPPGRSRRQRTPLEAATTTPQKPPAASPGGISFSPPKTENAMISFNGIRKSDGEPLFKSIDVPALAEKIRSGFAPARPAETEAAQRKKHLSFGPPPGTNEANLKQVGWGVVYGPNTPDEVKTALAPLLAKRKAAAQQFYRELDLQPGEDFRAFLARHGVAPGGVRPHKVPFHLLLVGPPDAIPFELQYLLSLEYSVGRLCFDKAEEYAAYAASLLAYEEKKVPARKRGLTFFGPTHTGDAATALSSKHLLTPLHDGEPGMGSLAERLEIKQELILGKDANRATLLKLLGDATSNAVVMTAGHGMGLSNDDPELMKEQGALITSDWMGGPIKPAHRVSAGDFTDDMDATGLVALLFACYGGGTPRFDDYAFDVQIELAPKPFAAALPRRLLGHKKGAIAVLAHVDRAWGFSIQPKGSDAPHVVPFEAFLQRVLAGGCLGTAAVDLYARGATYSAAIAEVLRPGANAATDQELVISWLERNDARAYVLYGDPSARLREE
ncbi:MAG: hypothetical protein HOW73_17090 [Polyangiaceae bacterium]|nr:hypothetical protein [Polyangiaceae bacterium]